MSSVTHCSEPMSLESRHEPDPGSSSLGHSTRPRMFEEAIMSYVERCREGRPEDAFHGLLELGDAVLPYLEAAYQSSKDPDLRSIIP